MYNTGWSVGVRLTLDERSQHEVYVFAEKWTSSEATKQALFIVHCALRQRCKSAIWDV